MGKLNSCFLFNRKHNISKTFITAPMAAPLGFVELSISPTLSDLYDLSYNKPKLIKIGDKC